ncbi:MAG TPA: hypothetical protein VMF62_09615 [Acetobacteraceae bacterium]|nr:hypothetical protein [Acetobacteraceae bacterium]
MISIKAWRVVGEGCAYVWQSSAPIVAMGAALYLKSAARAAGAGNTHRTLCAQPGTIVRGWLSPADLNVLEVIDKDLKPTQIGPLVRMRITPRRRPAFDGRPGQYPASLWRRTARMKTVLPSNR